MKLARSRINKSAPTIGATQRFFDLLVLEHQRVYVHDICQYTSIATALNRFYDRSSSVLCQTHLAHICHYARDGHEILASNIEVYEVMNLQEYYDQAFSCSQGEVYGSADNWTTIQRSGHFRRMEIIDNFDVGEISTSTALDFGMGSWGFACVFPKLRSARKCIGVDISEVAIRMSQEKDFDIRSKSTYLRSDMDVVPVQDDTVDIFWGGEVIEHVVEPRQYLQDVARACRDGAHVVMSTPNRDALMYLLAGQDFAIGPEHIALLNSAEFLYLTDLFFDAVVLCGYETSLSPDGDAALTDERMGRQIQERAFSYPALASGMIYHGIVNKSKLIQNRRDWLRTNLGWDDPSIHFVGEPQRMLLAGSEYAGGLPDRGVVRLSMRAAKYILYFWAHDWSGIVQITIGNKRKQVDLFSKLGGYKRIEFEFDNVGDRPITIERTGNRSDRSQDSQVLFHSIVSLRWTSDPPKSP
jgi:2-polyprenyl-3-methyl-5-hydroxy-6-metoxy-1,4-benzoquinol methylase